MQVAAMDMFSATEIVSSEIANVCTLDVMSAQWPLDNVYTEQPVEEVYLT